jgi:glycosyltransferase involved in cell wall biosynthesis
VKVELAVVLDPRFSGGTSSAVAREILVLADRVRLRVFGFETKMFKGRTVNPTLQAALDELGIEIEWNPRIIQSDVVAIHNPSCFKYDDHLDCRIICDRTFIITHENFLRPNRSEGFDVEKCLSLINKSVLCREKSLAPVSVYNRRGVEHWLEMKSLHREWSITSFIWFNICDFDISPPTDTPRDRRGRLSRPGFEKFPDLDVMEQHFPASAEACAILGGDTFLLEPDRVPKHWNVQEFGSVPVTEFMKEFDFFVYFTHPQWRESFGRVIAEAIAAGKVVITDTGTAEIFGDAVVASDGSDLDAVIAAFVEAPCRYRRFVHRAQQSLRRFGSEAFVEKVIPEIVRRGVRNVSV